MKESTSNQQQVNPKLIVILAIVIIGAGAYFYFSGANTSTSTTKNSNSSENNLNALGLVQPIQKDKDLSKKQAEDLKFSKDIADDIADSKNPFQVPVIYQKNEAATISPVNEKPRLIDVTQTEKPPTKVENDGIRLGAIFEQKNDKIALIYNEKRGYILHVNDMVPKSNFRVREILKNTVVITNGSDEEQVLKLEKDGGHK